MTWNYEQSTGRISHDDAYVDTGYSGAGDGKNNPDMQDVQMVGPIPRGSYTIGAPHDTTTHGPYVLSLRPDPANEMFGRSAFLIHGDSVKSAGTASQGCVILQRSTREDIAESGDTALEVT